MVSSQLSQYNLRCIPSWTLQRTGLDTAEGPTDFNSSNVTSLWWEVDFLRLWLWLQILHKYKLQVIHLTTAGSSDVQSSQGMVESLPSNCSWRATADIKLFMMKFTCIFSTCPPGTCTKLHDENHISLIFFQIKQFGFWVLKVRSKICLQKHNLNNCNYCDSKITEGNFWAF